MIERQLAPTGPDGEAQGAGARGMINTGGAAPSCTPAAFAPSTILPCGKIPGTAGALLGAFAPFVSGGPLFACARVHKPPGTSPCRLTFSHPAAVTFSGVFVTGAGWPSRRGNVFAVFRHRLSPPPCLAFA